MENAGGESDKEAMDREGKENEKDDVLEMRESEASKSGLDVLRDNHVRLVNNLI